MNKRVRNRLLITIGVTILAVYMFAGLPPTTAKMREKIRLGLDLRGGTHLVLQVVTDDAIKAETDQAGETVRTNLSTNNVLVRQIAPVDVRRFTAIGVDPNKDADFRRTVADRLPDWDIVSTAGEVPNTYTL